MPAMNAMNNCGSNADQGAFASPRSESESARLPDGPLQQPLGLRAPIEASSEVLLSGVTGAEQLKQQLCDLQHYTRSLFESSIDSLMNIDPRGVITDTNQQWEQLTGCSRGELIGSAFKEHFTDPARAENGIRLALREGKVTSYELTARAKDGKETMVCLNATTFNDQGGQPQVIFAAARDETERKRAESHFRGVMESAPEAMVILGQTGLILGVNSQTELLFGYARDELVGQPVGWLVPNRQPASHPAEGLAYFQKPRTRPVGEGPTLFGVRKDGSEFPVEVNLSPLETEEGILVIRDISARKQIEQAIHEKNLELEKASQAKDRFLARMSHELRTPLNAIIGFTGTLLMLLPGPLTDEQEDQLKTVERSATHLLSLINDLLDLAKIESGKVELHLVPVPCQSVVEEVIDALRPMAEQRQLTLSARIPEGDVLVRTDRRALTQILLNLTTNGLKFTERGGVRISLTQRTAEAGTITEISVADTGVGIRPEDQSRLFQAFEQVRENGKVQQGTGLGLQVSQKLARLLGGYVSLQSEPAKGSTFTLTIKDQPHGGEHSVGRGSS